MQIHTFREPGPGVQVELQDTADSCNIVMAVPCNTVQLYFTVRTATVRLYSSQLYQLVHASTMVQLYYVQLNT